MIALPPSDHKKKRKCTPNILPCKVNHTGPVNASQRLWSISRDNNDGKVTGHFRGRRLRGRTVPLPGGYRGAVLVKADRNPSQSNIVPSEPLDMEDDEEEDTVEREVEVFEEKASFDDIVSWGHEVLPNGMTDPFVKGLEEWIGFAERMHSFPGRKNSNSNSTCQDISQR